MHSVGIMRSFFNVNREVHILTTVFQTVKVLGSCMIGIAVHSIQFEIIKFCAAWSVTRKERHRLSVWEQDTEENIWDLRGRRIAWASLSVLPSKYYWSEQIKEGEMGVACNTHRIDKKCIQHFSQKSKGKTLLRSWRHERKDNIRNKCSSCCEQHLPTAVPRFLQVTRNAPLF